METKICGRCKEKKPLTEFHKDCVKKDGVQSMCINCRKEYHREHYLSNKKKYIEQNGERRKKIREEFYEYKKTLSCSKCGDSRWYVLDFHHKDSKKKDFLISKMVGGGYSKNRIEEEVSKCIVLCSNCHRELHFLSSGSSSMVEPKISNLVVESSNLFFRFNDGASEI
tara:strand:+ start:647 stop:1150 length:504 start_codon:yes stop_codon:yes gene_type:complete